MLASLAVALTVTPALAVLLLPHAEGAEEPPLLRRLQGTYERLVRRTRSRAGAGPHRGGAADRRRRLALYHFGGESLPEMRENHFILHMQGLPGTSLPQSMAAGDALARELKKIPAVTHVSQQAGRAELGEDTWGVEYSEVGVSLNAAWRGRHTRRWSNP